MSKKRQMIEAINDFVVGCKSDNIWDSIKACCILSGWNNLDGCLTPIKGDAPTNYNFVSNDYNRITGLAGDGSTKYLDSNRANNADPQNSKHIAYYATNQGNATRRPISSGWSTNGASQIIRGGEYQARINAAYLADIGIGTVALGFIGATRSDPINCTVRNAGANTTAAQASQTPNADNLWLFRGHSYTNARIAFYSIGESLDLEKLDNRVSTLITTIGDIL